MCRNFDIRRPVFNGILWGVKVYKYHEDTFLNIKIYMCRYKKAWIAGNNRRLDLGKSSRMSD